LDLLTRKEAAAKLRISEKTLASLPLPFVRMGRGRGKVLYRNEDLETYIRSKLRWHEEGSNHGDRVSKGHEKVGLSGLPSRETLQKIRLVNEGRG
jgi:hypothetical protein